MIWTALVAVMSISATTSMAASSMESVMTPQGWRPAEKVHQVPMGGKVRHVGEEIHLLDADDNIVHTAIHDRTPIATPATTSKRASGAVGSDWVAYAEWNTSAINPDDFIFEFSANWEVPPNPVTYDGQTISYSIGYATQAFDAILQPTLSYGNLTEDAAPGWVIVTWYTAGSETYSTTPNVTTTFNPDGSPTLLQGYVQFGGTSPGESWIYYGGFVGQASLAILQDDQFYTGSVVLAASDVVMGSDFPYSSSGTIFSDITVQEPSGATVEGVTWVPVSNTEYGIDTIVDIQGGDNGEITFTYSP